MKILEEKIKQYSGKGFTVSKTNGVSKIDFGDEKWIENKSYYAKTFLGDCDACTKLKLIYDNFSYDSILIGGLGLGLIPNYAHNVKNCSTIDVLEKNNELISYVDYLDENINVIQGDIFTYTPSKKYDLILFDIWWKDSDVTQEIQTSINEIYISHLNDGGKIVYPLIEKEVSKQ